MVSATIPGLPQSATPLPNVGAKTTESGKTLDSSKAYDREHRIADEYDQRTGRRRSGLEIWARHHAGATFAIGGAVIGGVGAKLLGASLVGVGVSAALGAVAPVALLTAAFYLSVMLSHHPLE